MYKEKDEKSMKEEEKKFFSELCCIQKIVINMIISKEKKFDSVESMLKETTYETIYRCMELFDGYGENKEKYEIKNLASGNVLNNDIELHNQCETYLQFSDV